MKSTFNKEILKREFMSADNGELYFTQPSNLPTRSKMLFVASSSCLKKKTVGGLLGLFGIDELSAFFRNLGTPMTRDEVRPCPGF